MRTRFAAPRAAAAVAAATALAALTIGCAPSDEPADPAALTTTATQAPPRATTTTAATTTAGGTGTGTSAAPTGENTSQVISVTVSGGQVDPAPGPVDVKLGSLIAIEVTSDVAEELHVHGYERTLPLQPGQPGRVVLTADIPGQFEVELESAHRLLFTLRVS